MMFENLLEEAILRAGGCKQLASEMNISPSEITRFRNGDTGMTLEKLNRLIEISGLTLIQEKELMGFETTIFTMANLYKRRTEK